MTMPRQPGSYRMMRGLAALALVGLRAVSQNLGALLGLAGVVALWVGLQHGASAEREQALLGASQNTSNLARAFEEHIIRSLKAIDQSLLFIRQAVGSNPQGFDVVSWARDTQSLTDMTFQISKIDRNGILAASNFAPNGNGIDLSDREHFRVHRDGKDDFLFVSKPVLGRASNKWSIQLTRKVIAADGSFDGVIVVSLDPFTLSRFYNSVDLGQNGMILLSGTDGIVRAAASGSAVGGDVGRSILGGQLFAAFERQWAGTLIAPSSLDDVRRVESFRGVQGFPLFVSVGIAEDDVMAVHRSNLRADTALAAGMTLLLLTVTALIVRRQVVLARARAELRASQAEYALKSRMLETTLEAMSQGILMVDADRRPQVCNQRALDLLGVTEPVAAGQKLPEVMAQALDDLEEVMPSDAPRDSQALQPELVQERLLENGTVLEVRTRALVDGGTVQTYTDITARAAAEEMLEAAAGLDHLTGLCNRNGFGSKLEQALQGAQRGGYAVTVLCIDLDHFKIVNDTMGHEAGDALLRIAAQRMRDILRDTDVIARMGGDEFAVVLSRHSPEGPEMVAQKLLDALAAPFRLRSGPAVIGASIGIATYPEDGATPELLLRHADIALYQAKASGRMAWRVYAPEGGLRERRRFVLEQDLREAVASRRFTLSYQPVCDLADGDPVGFEALLRWNHPERGAVSPLEFLPLAEETGLIAELQLWVIETACAEAATWARPAGISINVSPAWLRAPGAVESLRGVLTRTGLSPARLALEVTEAVLLPEDDMLLSRLGAMRVLGARLVLDDFGTSPGSLGHLGRFAFDQVKIDRSFMRALNSDRQARALVEAMLAIAHARGLEVVAEGVETQEQLSMLRHLRCDYVQGFLLGHPQSAERTRQELWDMAAREGEALERRII